LGIVFRRSFDLKAPMQGKEERHSAIGDETTMSSDASQFWAAPIDRLQQFCNATTDAIVFLDREYRFQFLNRRAWEMIWPRTDVLGTCLFDSYPGTAREDQPYIANYRRCMEEGTPANFEAYYPEPLNMWLRVQCYPSGEGIVLFFSDFTEERNAREELRERREAAEQQRNEVDTLYRTAPIGLALFDAKEFRYLRLNDRQAGFFGLMPEQMVGKPMTELAPIPGLRDLLEQVARGEPVLDHVVEGELVTQPGKQRYWMMSYFPIHRADGAVEAISAAWLEITQQKQAEDALIQSEKLGIRFEERTKLARDLHDTLLQTIQASKLAVDHTLDSIHESGAKGNLTQVSDWLERALSEGRAVLDFLRISSAEGKELAVAFRDAFEDCRGGKSVELEMSVSGTPRELRYTAREGVYRIGCEAIRNACSHSRGDHVKIELCYGSSELVLSVQDNGVGVDEETLEKGKVSHYGLTGMRERATRIGARLTITGSKQGTLVSLVVPAEAIYRNYQTRAEILG
jgi:PAS domain S-box-containing protein